MSGLLRLKAGATTTVRGVAQCQPLRGLAATVQGGEGGSAPAAKAGEFKIPARQVDALKSKTQIFDEVVAPEHLKAKHAALKAYVGVAANGADPVLNEQIRRDEMAAAKKDEKKKAEWTRILASDAPAETKAKRLVAAGAPSHVVLNTLHFGTKRVVMRRSDRYNTASLDYAGTARARFMEEFDTTGLDHEDSSDPDVLPRQRPFTRDEIHRLLQDVEETRVHEEDLTHQWLMPAQLVVGVQAKLAEMDVTHAVMSTIVSKGVSAFQQIPPTDLVAMAEKMPWDSASFKHLEKLAAPAEQYMQNGATVDNAAALAALHGTAGAGAALASAQFPGAGVGAAVATGASAGATAAPPVIGVGALPSAANVNIAGLHAAAAAHSTVLSGKDGFSALPLGAPTPFADARLPNGTVARPFANIFREAERVARRKGVSAFIEKADAAADVAGERVPLGVADGSGAEVPFRRSEAAERLWTVTRPAGVTAEEDPMVRRVSREAAEQMLHQRNLPGELAQESSYKAACRRLSSGEFNGFIATLAGKTREEQVAAMAELASVYHSYVWDSPTGRKYEQEELDHTPRKVKAGEEDVDILEKEAKLAEQPEVEESETLVLLRQLTKFNDEEELDVDEEMDPNKENDFRFGDDVHANPEEYTAYDAKMMLKNVEATDRFARYFQRPFKMEEDVEVLLGDKPTESFTAIQLAEHRKALAKRNAMQYTPLVSNKTLRKFGKGLALYSGVPAHLLEFLEMQAHKKVDARNLTHPLARKLAARVEAELAKAPTPGYAPEGSVFAHSDLEVADKAQVPARLQASLAKAQHKAAAAAASASETEPFAQSDVDTTVMFKSQRFVTSAIAENLALADLESDFEAEIAERVKLFPASQGKHSNDRDVRLVDGSDGDVEPVVGVAGVDLLVQKLYGREARLATEVSALLGSLDASERAAVQAIYAISPAAAKSLIAAARSRFSVLAAIGAGKLQLPRELLEEQGLGSLKALIPPQVNFARALAAIKATNAATAEAAAAAGSAAAAAPAAAAGSAAGAAAGAAAAGPSVGNILASAPAVDSAVASDIVFDEAAAPRAARHVAADAEAAFAEAMKFAAEAVRIENERRAFAARGTDVTGLEARARNAARAAKTFAARAARLAHSVGSDPLAALTGGNAVDEEDAYQKPVHALAQTTDAESMLENEHTAQARLEAADPAGPDRHYEAAEQLQAVAKREMAENDSLARTFSDPVEYMSDNLSHTQFRSLYNTIEQRRDLAFRENRLADNMWGLLQSANRARETMLGLDGTTTEENEITALRREIVTGSLLTMNKRAEVVSRLEDHDTVILDVDHNAREDHEDMNVHRTSRVVTPYDIKPVTDTLIPPYIAIEQQTNLYNLHQLDPATFHPRWIARRLNIAPNAVAGILKAQDLMHKRSLVMRESKTMDLADYYEEMSGDENAFPARSMHDERVIVPRLGDDLQVPFPPEVQLASDDEEATLARDAPHLLGRVSWDASLYRDPVWRGEFYKPVRIVGDEGADVVQAEQAAMERRWASHEEMLDAVEKASFAQFGPVHWASGTHTLHRPPKLPREVIASNLHAPARHNWVLTGTDEIKRATYSIMVRDRDGYLRHPTFREFQFVRRRERDARLPFHWRKYRVLAKVPDVSAAYIDQVYDAAAALEGNSGTGMTYQKWYSDPKRHEAIYSDDQSEFMEDASMADAAFVVSELRAAARDEKVESALGRAGMGATTVAAAADAAAAAAAPAEGAAKAE